MEGGEVEAGDLQALRNSTAPSALALAKEPPSLPDYWARASLCLTSSHVMTMQNPSHPLSYLIYETLEKHCC